MYYLIEDTEYIFAGQSYSTTATDITLCEGKEEDDYNVQVEARIYDSEGSFSTETASIRVIQDSDMTNFENYCEFLEATKDEVVDILTYTTQCVTAMVQFTKQLDRMDISEEDTEEYLRDFCTYIEDAYESSLSASEEDIGNSLIGFESLATITTWGTHGDIFQSIKKLIDLLPAYQSSTAEVSATVY
eukprot:CAMPEP_0201286046 /NCGR_PEP_ID=MMETSP1317-20130820/114185_1 /ASSEMBLY_ACC=CAM_ASM_000770 /TAXON_ID=187299 /ORGANISM="Undescribed Undescribed, Strain Undescribed" /LENGTH=187 /DNA_ID=CAMNT_0047612499 /DNA_START=5177 /DNA_END=5740 /DNA_ORIENTATION=-